MALLNPGDLCSCRPWDVQPECCCPDWPLPWPIPCDTPAEDLTPDQRRALWAQAAASEKLHILTAYRWGLCEDTVRPCGPMTCEKGNKPAYGMYGGWGFTPYEYGPIPFLRDGQPYNCTGCDCACACDIKCTIPLPGPVNEVLSVTVDGQELCEGTDWFVNGEGGLSRLNGCWPHNQDMTQPCGTEGTFCVRYLRGINPNASLGAIQAVSALACKMWHDACGTTGGCPDFSGASRITRGGVTWENDQEAQAAGRTGVGVVDDWLDLVNPRGIRKVPTVHTPDVRKWKFRGVSETRRTVPSAPCEVTQ